jgi:hypothetical protein
MIPAIYLAAFLALASMTRSTRYTRRLALRRIRRTPHSR